MNTPASGPPQPTGLSRSQRMLVRARRVPPLNSLAVRRALLRMVRSLRRARRRLFERFGSGRYSRPAQHGIDRTLGSVLPERGYFVEAGAGDGYRKSNTYYLERFKGWRGILVEPIPSLAARCRRDRPASQVYECALVADPEVRQVPMRYADLMSAVKDNELGVRSPEVTLGWDEAFELTVPATTLSELLDRSGAPRVDLLSLDVEGYEAEVLRGLDLDRHGPVHLLVEIHEIGRRRGSIDAVLGDDYEFVRMVSPVDALYRRRS